MEENKNVVTGNEVANNEEQKTAEAGAQQQDQAEKKENRVVGFFKKNGKKIGGVAAIVGAVGVGVALDRIGIKNPFKKKGDNEEVATED
ncbi:MAG: hypothetical protein J6N70_14755 [Oribacterium sp.]|nr:hypothetical protein [Oribacterium sp.]